MLTIEYIKYKDDWDRFFNTQGSPTFLQSWEWGEFNKSLGYDIFRLGINEIETSHSQNKKLIGLAQVIIMKTKRGNFLFVPHGPIANLQNTNEKMKEMLITLRNFCREKAKLEHCSFLRFAPYEGYSKEKEDMYKNLGFHTAPIYMHAERAWILSLQLSEAELLSQMRKTTRYLIKKAGRDGIKIEKRTDQTAIHDFMNIYEETARREHFVPFSKSYIEKEFSAFDKTKNAVFFFGKVNNKYLAAALILFTKSTAFYHQGASIHTKLPVPYLLQWEAICEAKKRGCAFYNFWGIIKEGRTPSSWKGLTLFKIGFGGHAIDTISTQDYIISPMYFVTALYERFLHWKRNH